MSRISEKQPDYYLGYEDGMNDALQGFKPVLTKTTPQDRYAVGYVDGYEDALATRNNSWAKVFG